MKLKQIIILLIFVEIFFVCRIYGQPQTHKDYYSEVKKNINFPAGFDKEKAERIISNIALEKEYYFEDGRLVADESIQQYVNQVAAKLLMNDKTLLEKVHVWVLKNLSANAISYLDGSIFINQGLLLKLDNESELAFIIGHEISHIKKQHSLNAISIDKKVAKQEVNAENNAGRLYRHFSHSKENEYEADGFALNLIIQTNYDPAKVIHALLVIEDTTSLLNPINIVLNKMLNSELSSFDTMLMKEKTPKNKNKDTTDEVNFLGNISDDFSTHPDINKRMIAIDEQIKNYEKNTTVQINQIKEQSDFDKMKKVLVNSFTCSAMDQYQYPRAFYFCLQQLETKQVVEYNSLALKCLYFIALAKQNKYEEQMIDKINKNDSSDLNQLNNLFLSYNTDKFKKLVYGFAKSLYEKNKQNEDIHFYFALTNELYLGTQTSKIIFQNIQNKYPKGKYASFINTKLN